MSNDEQGGVGKQMHVVLLINSHQTTTARLGAVAVFVIITLFYSISIGLSPGDLPSKQVTGL